MYEKGNIEFKGLKISWKLLDSNVKFPNSNKEDKTRHEEFRFYISNKDLTETFPFFNSQMELNISNDLENFKDYNYNLRVKDFKQYMTKTHLWGGYDEIKSFKELDKERTFNLVYGFLNFISSDLANEQDTFKDFCDKFGYDIDSLKLKKIYYEIINQCEKLNNVLNKKQKDYFVNKIAVEEEVFEKDLRGVLK